MNAPLTVMLTGAAEAGPWTMMPEAMTMAVRAAMGDEIFTSVLLFPGGLDGRLGYFFFCNTLKHISAAKLERNDCDRHPDLWLTLD